jgi:hypothetical protein
MRYAQTCQLLLSATLCAAVSAAGCGSDGDDAAQGGGGSGTTGGAGGSGGSAGQDSDAEPLDAGPEASNDSGNDAIEPDTSAEADTPDTAVDADTPDTPTEADTPDVATDALDSGVPDVSDEPDPPDGDTDANTPDADSADALDALTDGDVLDADASDGSSDATEESDTGSGSGGVWLEIDYSSAYTSQSPAWAYSATPGWGEAQWAPDGWTRPEAWDRFNNMIVEWDPMGSKALTIGSSSELQLMIGLEELTSYSHATVRLEGRSRTTSSSVHFNVVNPINGCSVSGSMSNDWTIHVEELDFGQCLVPGAGLQAVRVDPTSGTLALVRMRVTLHDAQW